MQEVTDGSKSVIGHHNQEEDVQCYEECNKTHLDDVVFIGYYFALCLNVKNNFGTEVEVKQMCAKERLERKK